MHLSEAMYFLILIIAFQIFARSQVKTLISHCKTVSKQTVNYCAKRSLETMVNTFRYKTQKIENLAGFKIK